MRLEDENIPLRTLRQLAAREQEFSDVVRRAKFPPVADYSSGQIPLFGWWVEHDVDVATAGWFFPSRYGTGKIPSSPEEACVFHQQGKRHEVLQLRLAIVLVIVHGY